MTAQESVFDLALALLGEAYGAVSLAARAGQVHVQVEDNAQVFEGATVEQALVAAAEELLDPAAAARVRRARA